MKSVMGFEHNTLSTISLYVSSFIHKLERNSFIISKLFIINFVVLALNEVMFKQQQRQKKKKISLNLNLGIKQHDYVDIQRIWIILAIIQKVCVKKLQQCCSKMLPLVASASYQWLNIIIIEQSQQSLYSQVFKLQTDGR